MRPWATSSVSSPRKWFQIAADPVPDYPDAWSPSLTAMQRIGDRLYGLPYHDGPQCLIYRHDRVAEPAHRQAFERRYHRPLAIPETWHEYLEVVIYFSRPEDGTYELVLRRVADGDGELVLRVG